MSHCLLDPLTRAEGTRTIERDLITVLVGRGVSLVQLPCPEMVYGFDRPLGDKEDYDTAWYRGHCRTLAEEVAETVEAYARFHLLGLVSVGGSPSCGFQRTHKRGEHVSEPGVFMEELERVFKEKGITMRIVDHELLYGERMEEFLSL